MKKLLTTTALIAALTVPGAMAQTTTAPAPADSTMAATPTVAVPEGFTLRVDQMTAEDLLGATVYDSNGDSIGSVQDLILSAATDPMPGAATGMGDTTLPATTGTDPMPPAGTDTTATDPLPPAGTDTTATDTMPPAGTDTTATDTMPPAGTDSTATGTVPPAGTDTAATDTMPPAGTDSTATDTMPPASTDTTATGTMPPAAGTDSSAMPPSTDMATPPATGMATGSASDAGSEPVLSHAILDIGGFLGLGVHRVAIPVEDLQIYSNDAEVRVYLPWTREQIEALQEYDENDPTTLGAPMRPAAN